MKCLGFFFVKGGFARLKRVGETRGIHNDIFLFLYHVQCYFAYTHAVPTKGAGYSIVGVHINACNMYTILSSISKRMEQKKREKTRQPATRNDKIK